VIALSLSLARTNFLKCLKLLEAFISHGLKYLVLCPGSRSGPLALAAARLSESRELTLITSLDERSGAYLALGIGTSTGNACAVVTTSGTAVANLLPASVEADRSCQPLLLITADRPLRLKECGSNQTVNQEEFLNSVCRSIKQGPLEGIHLCSEKLINEIVESSWSKAHQFPGPVHLNLSIDEPLHPSFEDQEEIFSRWKVLPLRDNQKKIQALNKQSMDLFTSIDIFRPGIVLAGPWRGKSEDLNSFNKYLRKFQLISHWPIFADPLSGIEKDINGLIGNWEILIDAGITFPGIDLQILRLGPLPASRSIEPWLISLKGQQIVITEGEKRSLDPLGISKQWSYGFISWYKNFLQNLNLNRVHKKNISNEFLNTFIKYDEVASKWLNEKLPLKGFISEPSLARWIPILLPEDLPVMLSASSPVRDWISYSGKESLARRCFGFRGASGIDGTLSLAMGIAVAKGKTALITGDLALLHDTNGWLFFKPNSLKLLVILIDNGGGGIFTRLELEEFNEGDIEKLFLMPQPVTPFDVAKSYGVPCRQVSCLEDLELAIEWGISLDQTVLIRVCSSPYKDHELRRDLREDFKKHFQMIIQNDC
tara:strand:- start:819 stop:2612 length:1794 start_codon:yes stop_codon:yes gene_type:complete